jgi:hypothetical protein
MQTLGVRRRPRERLARSQTVANEAARLENQPYPPLDSVKQTAPNPPTGQPLRQTESSTVAIRKRERRYGGGLTHRSAFVSKLVEAI